MFKTYLIIYLISAVICWFMIKSWRKENKVWKDDWNSFYKAIAISTIPLLNILAPLGYLFAMIIDKIEKLNPKPPKWL